MIAFIHAYNDLENKAMSRTLLKLSRGIDDSQIYNFNGYWCYEHNMLRRWVPEIAKLLDPDIELREQEKPSPSDNQYVRDYFDLPDPERLARIVKISCGSLGWLDCRLGDESTRSLGDMLCRDDVHGNPIKIAMNRIVPGTFEPFVVADPARPVLEGYQIYAMLDTQERVVEYRDDLVDIEERLDQIQAFYTRGEILEGSGFSDLSFRPYDRELKQLSVRRWKDDEEFYRRAILAPSPELVV